MLAIPTVLGYLPLPLLFGCALTQFPAFGISFSSLSTHNMMQGSYHVKVKPQVFNSLHKLFSGPQHIVYGKADTVLKLNRFVLQFNTSVVVFQHCRYTDKTR